MPVGHPFIPVFRCNVTQQGVGFGFPATCRGAVGGSLESGGEQKLIFHEVNMHYLVKRGKGTGCFNLPLPAFFPSLDGSMVSSGKLW